MRAASRAAEDSSGSEGWIRNLISKTAWRHTEPCSRSHTQNKRVILGVLASAWGTSATLRINRPDDPATSAPLLLPTPLGGDSNRQVVDYPAVSKGQRLDS